MKQKWCGWEAVLSGFVFLYILPIPTERNIDGYPSHTTPHVRREATSLRQTVVPATALGLATALQSRNPTARRNELERNKAVNLALLTLP